MKTNTFVLLIIAIASSTFGFIAFDALSKIRKHEDAINRILDTQLEHAKIQKEMSVAVRDLALAHKIANETGLGMSFVIDEHGLYLKSIQEALGNIKTSNDTNVSFGDEVDFMTDQGKIILIRPKK